MIVSIVPMGKGMYRAMAKVKEVTLWAFGNSHTDAMNKVFSQVITHMTYESKP